MLEDVKSQGRVRLAFSLGAGGSFMSAVIAVGYGAIALWVLTLRDLLPPYFLVPFLAVASLAGFPLHLAGLWGLSTSCRSRPATVALAIGIVASIALFMGTVSILTPPPVGSFVVAAFIAIGAFFVAEGVAFIAARPFRNVFPAAYNAAILMIVSGVMVATVFLAVFGGFFVLAVALVLAGLAYRNAAAFRTGEPLEDFHAA